MIAISCRHCGERMQVTDDEAGRRANCGSCGQSISIPQADAVGRRPRCSSGWLTQDARVTRQSHWANGSLAIHERATRVETPPPTNALWTMFLDPPREADELGRLGAYRILGVLGAGGMGVVYRAHEAILDRLVALKLMLPSLATHATCRLRFLREARLAAAIQHDHVVTIFHVGEERGIPFLTMPLLRGETLEQGLQRQRFLSLSGALRIAGQIAQGLVAIHELGLVHRDIKPGNVFLEGESRRVKILDFGLARAISEETPLTRDGTLIGSPAFMAPEQASRQPIDARADLFSLGTVLYQMLAGVPPFERHDTVATLLAVQTEEPLPLENVPQEVAALVLQLLAKKPANRPASAEEVVKAIARLQRSATCW